MEQFSSVLVPGLIYLAALPHPTYASEILFSSTEDYLFARMMLISFIKAQ
jgi:hypothetical protein